MPPAVPGDAPADVCERAPRDFFRDAALTVVGPHIRQRGDEHVQREEARERARRAREVRHVDRPAYPAHSLHEACHGFLQEPERLRVAHDPVAQPHGFVDVLVRYSEVEKHLGQFVAVRQHEKTPSSIYDSLGERPSRRVRFKREW